jgi:mono/diheme cytochrome c family protein
MNDIKRMSRKLITICMFPLVLTACGGASEVSFSQDVKPILDQNCSQCHQVGGEGEVASGFDMATYDGLMKGAKFGPMIIAGDAEGSNMLVLMEGRADPSISMPHGQNKPVSKQDVQIIRSWIEQGAKNN